MTASSTDATMNAGSQIRVGVSIPSFALTRLYALTAMPDAFMAPKSMGTRSVGWKLTARSTRSLEVVMSLASPWSPTDIPAA